MKVSTGMDSEGEVGRMELMVKGVVFLSGPKVPS